MKQVKITLRHKKTGIILELRCHHFMADSRAYYLSGVAGHKDYAFGEAYNKLEWERI